jgi:DMSO/TMAO reductase YedYZ molybdopterin-dependent catalytic subunit
MGRRLTNALLLATVLTLLCTGLIAWAIPESQATPLYALHRIAGVGLVLALPWKQLVARVSLARRIRIGIAPSAIPGIVATIALAVTVGLGLAWTFGLVSFDRPIPYSAMNLHVFAGIALVPLVLWHLARRWEMPRARDIASRRAALRLLALGAVAAAVGSLLERFPAGRRITGSKHAGSFTGNSFPLTIWAFDQVPTMDAHSHRIELAGLIADRTPLDMSAIRSAPHRETNAIIDCTGGWWSEQRWGGASLRYLLGLRGLDPAARTVTVRSVTGHSWSFGLDELNEALLATHVGGDELTAGHGYPARLVVPGRRGFQWIKWVGRIEVS